MKKILVLAIVSTILIPTSTAEASHTTGCISHISNRVISTQCNNGYYAKTTSQGGYKISTWYNSNNPEFMVMCRSRNNRLLAPVHLCTPIAKIIAATNSK